MPGVAYFIQSLQQANKQVYLVSGGFCIMIEPIAQQLHISKDHIVANTLLFNNDADSSYRGFDLTEPTSADMDKPKALTHIQQQGGYQTMVMMGDGAMDAQAKPLAVTFIGFGGMVRHEKVMSLADWFVSNFAHSTHIVQQFGTW